MSVTQNIPLFGSAGPATLPEVEPPPVLPETPERETRPSEPSTVPFSPPQPGTAPEPVPDGDPCREYPFCTIT